MATRLAGVLTGVCLALAGCSGGLSIGSGTQDSVSQPAPSAPASTPTQRTVQVAWTAASARYCAFGLNPQKLKGDYLAWERAQGLPPETIQNLDAMYDKAFLTFYAKVKDTPGYCSKAKIEEIRPEINRHLAGDYTPRKRVVSEDNDKATN